MKEKKYRWHKLAESIENIYFGENGMAEVDVAGKTICLVLSGEQVWACARQCPHAGGRLAEGYIDVKGNIVCPVHRYRFSPVNGRNVSGEGYYLKVYPVELRENGVFVGFEEGGMFDWLF
jgi:3-phenylpropionate/trans-cinnamate dioxygenase ferredoxin subunit